MARHLEETDIPIEYRGMKYNISPSALRSNNLTVELPEVVVRPTTPQTNDKAYYQRWLIRQASRGGKNMSSSDREAYDRMMRRIANQNEVKNFIGFDSTIYNHGNGALEQISPEFDALTLGRQFYTDGLFNAVGKNIIKKGKNTIASYDLYNNIKNGKINKINIPSKILYRANVYRGGKIKYPKYSFFTTDEKYASQYGKVNPYIFESKNIAVSKEPLMGYKDPVNNDMMIYRNTKNNPSANDIIGYDKVTGEFPYQSRGAEILNLDPNNIFPIKVNDFKTINFKSIGKGVSKKVSKGTFEHLSPTQWTPEQWTAAQDAAIARGNMTEAQRLRDLHFQVSAPNTKVKEAVFNGSLSDKPFYEFNTDFRDAYWGGRNDYTTGAWFGTGNENTMLSFAGDNPNRLRRFYLNFNNPFIKDAGHRRWDKLLPFDMTEKDIAIEAAKLREKGFPEYVIEDWKKGLNTTTDNYALKLETTNYDSGIIKNVYENKAYPNSDYGVITDYIASKPNQIKLADAVTYDNNGVRIPLGLRDNFRSKDIRYGLIPLSIGGKYLHNKVNNNKLKQ